MRLVDAVAFAERHPSQAAGPRKKDLGAGSKVKAYLPSGSYVIALGWYYQKPLPNNITRL